jgi:hypothetical protein
MGWARGNAILVIDGKDLTIAGNSTAQEFVDGLLTQLNVRIRHSERGLD